MTFIYRYVMLTGKECFTKPLFIDRKLMMVTVNSVVGKRFGRQTWGWGGKCEKEVAGSGGYGWEGRKEASGGTCPPHPKRCLF